MVIGSKDCFKPYTDDITFARIKELKNLSELVGMFSSDYSDRVAIEFNKEKYTYCQLTEDIARFRPVIYDEKNTRDTIGLYANNSYDFVKAFLAITTVGYDCMILPRQMPVNIVNQICKKYNIKKIVTDDLDLISTKELDGVIISNIKELHTDLMGAKHSSESDDCVIMFTGGTTGQSKGVVLSHEAVLSGVINGCYGYKDVFYQKYLLLLPLSHVFGLIRNLLTPLYTGGTIYISSDMKACVSDIGYFNPNILVLVPALADMLLSLSNKMGKQILGKDLKYVICGSAFVNKYLIDEYNKFGVALFPGYGLTESANLVSGNPESFKKPDSVGIFYPNQEYQIKNGELLLKGKNMLSRYLDENDNNLYFEDGWFKTGDLVKVDDEGFLYITGRVKDLIILENGENISPAEIESHFNSLEFVKDCLVFEDVDEKGKHILAIEVLPRDLNKICEEIYLNEMYTKLKKVNEELPSNLRVNKISIRNTDFERTPSMKVKRNR